MTKSSKEYRKKNTENSKTKNYIFKRISRKYIPTY